MTAVLALGLSACGDDDDNGDSTASPTSSPSATSGGPTTTNPLQCDDGLAYVDEIGEVGDFEPVTDDTLTVVTSLPGPGFWEGSDTDPTDITGGFEYHIAQKIQEALGLSKLVVRNETFDSIVAGTVTDFDVALSQVTITCERAQVVRFGIPYFESNQGVLVQQGTELTTLEQAKAARWGVQTGTTAISLLEEVDPDDAPSVYQSLADAYTALSAGQVDAVLIDTAINLGQAARSNGQLEVVAQFEQPSGPDQYGALYPRDSNNVPAINRVFQDLVDSGELATLAKDDLSADPGDLPIITAG
jgi:polar amino acid transport system substrate-binding protein